MFWLSFVPMIMKNNENKKCIFLSNYNNENRYNEEQIYLWGFVVSM